jgi:hypothetical protein
MFSNVPDSPASRIFEPGCRLYSADWSCVLGYQRIRREQGDTFDHRLRDEDSIEWVFVEKGQ